MRCASSFTKTASTPAKRSIRTALFAETFVLIAIAVLLTTVAAFILGRHELTFRSIGELQSAAQGRKTLLESTLAREREQLAILAQDPTLARLPAITSLIGFRQLLRITSDKTIEVIAGETDRMLVSDEILQDARSVDHTVFEPVFSDFGWVRYVIATPQIDADGMRAGTFVAVFDPKELMGLLFQTEYVSAQTEVLLAIKGAHDIVLLHSDGRGGAVPVQTGTTEQRAFVEKAFGGVQGYEETVDYGGIRVLAAYQTSSTLGWSILVQKDAYEVTRAVWRLARSLIGIGLLLVGLLSFSMYALAQRVTRPLADLTRKLHGLETRHWTFQRSIFTGNELEIVDEAAMDLTERLRKVYDHLEELVRERTQALREQFAKDAAILENVEYGLLMTDAKGIVVSMNRAAELLTKAEQQESLGQPVTSILRIIDKNGNVIPETMHPVHLVIAEKKRFAPVTDPELSLRRKDGTETALHIRITPILRGNQCIGAVTVFRDTTEERHIDHVKSEFITLVSHQLRTPLSSMGWYLEMLLGTDGGPLTVEQRDNVEEVATSTARMVRLVNSLLNVSKLELGNLQLTYESIELQTLFREIEKSFALELKRKGMTLRTNSAIGTVKTDRGLLGLLIENLVSNAIKYGSDKTEIVVDVERGRTPGTLTLSVKNTGMGIPELEQKQIFQKLFRATNAKAIDTDGNGLGLYISHIAAEAIGAELTFESVQNAETTFRLTLPASETQK